MRWKYSTETNCIQKNFGGVFFCCLLTCFIMRSLLNTYTHNMLLCQSPFNEHFTIQWIWRVYVKFHKKFTLYSTNLDFIVIFFRKIEADFFGKCAIFRLKIRFLVEFESFFGRIWLNPIKWLFKMEFHEKIAHFTSSSLQNYANRISTTIIAENSQNTRKWFWNPFSSVNNHSLETQDNFLW